MTEERATYELIHAPAVWWMGFTLNTTPEQASAAFLKKYGMEPAEIKIEPGLMYVGPIPKRDDEE